MEDTRKKKSMVKTLILQDRQGREQRFLLRRSRPGDEKGMIACIRDEYGDTYFKRDFYRPEYLRQEAECGHITFLVAEALAEGESPGSESTGMPASRELAGMLILKEFYPEESMCEIASQIFRKKYRGFGLAMPFFEYGMDILLSRNYSAAYCLPVLFHDVTQRLLQRLGLAATGFVLNVFDTGHITHSYQNGRNTKHSQGIQIRAVGKRDAGTLYLPEEHQEFCRMIYDRLGVRYQIRKEGGGIRDRLPGDTKAPDGSRFPKSSRIALRQDSNQCSLEIRIHRIGADLLELIKAVHSRYPLRGKQTANVFLNIHDENAVWAYERLVGMGYFFTGLKPLCSEREYMVLHNPGEVEIYLDDYILTGEFEKLAEYIKTQLIKDE